MHKIEVIENPKGMAWPTMVIPLNMVSYRRFKLRCS